MSDHHNDTSHIKIALGANGLIAVIKGVTAFFTGSGAMLAEAIHSAADCGNQGLLLLGVRSAAKPPDARHPLGYGRYLYFWSFMVAVLLFTGGGVFSLYEGWHKFSHPEQLEYVWVGIGVLLVSIVLELGATRAVLVKINERRGKTPFVRFLRETKDSDLIVVFGEDMAAVLGLTVAALSLFVAWSTGDPRWDAVGSATIGLLLVAVAVFLAYEVRSLLVGEAADPGIVEAVEAAAAGHPTITGVHSIITIQQGPGEVMVALKATFQDGVATPGIYAEIDAFETAVRLARPEVKWLFVEPDTAGDVRA